MSYTIPVIPISRDETDRRLENVVNRLKRHCKIGKVTPKLPKPIRQPVVPDFWKMWPFNDDARLPAPQYMDRCGCKVGTACGNVACPHRLAATC